MLLIATPVARVIFSVFAFARQRDFAYVGITLIVLVLEFQASSEIVASDPRRAATERVDHPFSMV